METLELTTQRTIRIWWTFFWRAVLGSIVLGFGLGFIIGFLAGILGIELSSLTVLLNLSGFALGIAVSIYFFNYAISKKHFKDFKIVLVPHESSNQTTLGESNAS